MTKPIVWLYAYCYNEIDMLPFFLQHYESWVEQFVFYDMQSNDGTRELILSHPRCVLIDHPLVSVDDKRMAGFASHMYYGAKSDWILVVDIDELVWLHVPLEELGHSLFKPCGYQMVSSEFPKRGEPITDQIRYGFRDTMWDKVCLFPIGTDIVWRPGRHESNINPPNDKRVKLLHYRYLGDEYFTQRNNRNFNRMTEENVRSGRGYHVYPTYNAGRYSLQWFKDRVANAEQVIP